MQRTYFLRDEQGTVVVMVQAHHDMPYGDDWFTRDMLKLPGWPARMHVTGSDPWNTNELVRELRHALKADTGKTTTT